MWVSVMSLFARTCFSQVYPATQADNPEGLTEPGMKGTPVGGWSAPGAEAQGRVARGGQGGLQLQLMDSEAIEQWSRVGLELQSVDSEAIQQWSSAGLQLSFFGGLQGQGTRHHKRNIED